MSTLHEAARLVVAAWTSTRRAWVEECNYAVLALDAALKAEPAQEPITRIFGTLPVHDAQQPEPAQEPVAKMTAGRAVYFMERFKREEKLLGPNEQAALDFVISMLEQQPEPAQEPVAWRFKPMVGSPWSLSDDGYYISCKRDKGYLVEPLYTAPPQRPLTDEEIDRLWHDNGAGIDAERFARIARAIERKLEGE